MRIVLIGQAAFGEKSLQALHDAGDEIVAVYCPPDVPGGRPDPTKVLAEKLGIKVLQPKRMRNKSAVAEYLTLNADLNVMVFVTDIVRESILNSPKYGTIEYHPSLLPKHRGRSAINWAIINGDSETGLSIFWVDQGIDTGPILLQKTVSIEPDDTLGTIYFNKLFPMGVEAIVESVRLVREGKAPKIVQDESQATSEPPCTSDLLRIDWSQPVQTTYNMIRGANPTPGALTTFDGKDLKVFDAAMVPSGIQGEPGAVVEIGEKGIVVKAGEGAIVVKRLQPEGSPKITAADFVKAADLKVGQKLG